jgi:translation initiation factor IF-1
MSKLTRDCATYDFRQYKVACRESVYRMSHIACRFIVNRIKVKP